MARRRVQFAWWQAVSPRRKRQLLPHVRAADYGVIVGACVMYTMLLMPLFFGYLAPAGATRSFLIALPFAVAYTVMMLNRWRRLRRFTREFATDSESLYLPFDEAQVQDASGRFSTEIHKGCVQVTDDGVLIWAMPDSGANVTTPEIRLAKAEVVEVRSETLIRIGTYPLLLFVTSDSAVIRVRILGGTGPVSRFGKTKKEMSALLGVIRERLSLT